MMCHRAQDKLVALLDGELPGDTAAEVVAHLSECARCTALRDRYASVVLEPSAVVAANTRARMWTRLDAVLDAAWEANEQLEAVATESPPPPRAPANRSITRWLFAFAYAALLALALGWSFGTWQENRALRAELAATTSRSLPATAVEMPEGAFVPASYTVKDSGPDPHR